ncbi:MAG TPA: S41 family peptidase [Solirubrobacteraceae bacterium]|nr:S41 family peptidase [Solirubrobacteraceae bacterium]
MQNSIQRTMLAIVAAVLVLIAGIWWGGHPADLPPILRNAFVSHPNGSVVDEALADIEHDYFRRQRATQLQNNAITGAVDGLADPYAAYQTPEEFRGFGKAPGPSRFSGVGIDVLPLARGLLVQSVIAGTPAARGGVKAGDVIVAANGSSFAGRRESYSTSVIQGSAGTTVRLTIERGKRRFTVALTRAKITAPAAPLVVGRLVVFHGTKVAVIELTTFEVSGIHTQVANALRRLLRRGAEAIVLDLRDNGGGLVREAQLVASLFIRHGVIVTTRGRAQPTQTLYATGQPLAANQPLAVLVNGGTASAAEIVTGALQVDHRATVVGTHTYGKGVFQEVRGLSNGGAIDITVGEYFLPNGRNLGAGGLRRGHGIRPNVIVGAAVTAHGDPVLIAALRLLAARVH